MLCLSTIGYMTLLLVLCVFAGWLCSVDMTCASVRIVNV